MTEGRTPDEGARADWVDRATALARRLGLNPVRVRWKLEAWRARMQARRDDLATRVDLVRRRQQNCPHCGRLVDGVDRRCSSCGAPLEGRAALVLRRAGLALPDFLSVSTLLAAAILAVYARMVAAQGAAEWFELRIDVLVRFGGQWPPLVTAGEWWRLGTAVFLHAGALHLGFNLLALSQVGPAVETVFGRSRMLFFFMATGVAGSLASYLVGLNAVSIGASGAILGLIGAAAGWGHRAGTPQGRNLRNHMLLWAAYTMVFGLLVGADNAAHAGGFLAGAALGLVSRPVWSQGPAARRFAPLFGLVGFAAAATSVALVLKPPVEHRDDEPDTLATRADATDLRRIAGPYKRACVEYRAGRLEAAWNEIRAAGLEESAGADAGAGVNPDLLEMLCDGIDDMLERCRRFRAGGLAALQDPPADPRLRAQVEEAWRVTCAAWSD